MFCWYIGNVTQIVMAVNRWAVICLRNSSMFTKRHLIIFFLITTLFAIIKSYIIQYVFPCCKFLVDQTVLSYSYFLIEDVPNYTDQSDIPLNALSSIVPVICYSWIFYTIRGASQSINPGVRTELQKKRGHQELSYAMQFCLISMFYTFSWIMFRVFPLIFGGRQIEWFILTSLCHVFNCSANAFVYIMFNKEVKNSFGLRLPSHFRRTAGRSSPPTRSVTQKMLFTLKQLLGVLFGALSGLSLFLNVLALVAVFRLAFVLRKNQVYIIAFFNIWSDVLQMSFSTFYLAPSIVTSSFLISKQKKDEWTLLLGSCFLFLWHFETITQMIMALNRFIVICLQKHNVFTFTSTTFIFVFLIPFCLLSMYLAQYVSPCCTFLFDQEFLSYSYYPIEGIPNYSNQFDLPLNATSSTISAICYILIYWTVHKSTPANSSVNDAQRSRRLRDIKYAMQFSLILAFYIFVWVLFRVLPVLLKDRHVEWFILVPICYTINCTSNALVYLGFNSEVQSNVRPQFARSILYRLGLSAVYSVSSGRTMLPTVTDSRVSFGEPVRPIAMRYIPKRRMQPFRSIGFNFAPH
ncbi:unnamed protein product [Caenorhabditis sp. 36 PRJEB53466]|nr:unnamed protein product [Caenorhabditis sp. 36 PRJEB53466]